MIITTHWAVLIYTCTHRGMWFHFLSWSPDAADGVPANKKKKKVYSGACHRYSQAESFFFFFLRYSSLEYTHTPGWENTAAAASQPIVCVYIASDMPYRYLYTTTTTTNEEIFLVIYFYFFLFFNILLLEKDEQQQQQQLAFMNR